MRRVRLSWNVTVPPAGQEWLERDEFCDLSDRSFREQLRPIRNAGRLKPRLFHSGDSSLMRKHPFFRMEPETLNFNHHWLWQYDEVTKSALGAMVHLKLMHDFIERFERYEREGQHWRW